jgi:hypothetical protein
MEAAKSSEKLLSYRKITRRHNPGLELNLRRPLTSNLSTLIHLAKKFPAFMAPAAQEATTGPEALRNISEARF